MYVFLFILQAVFFLFSYFCDKNMHNIQFYFSELYNFLTYIVFQFNVAKEVQDSTRDLDAQFKGTSVWKNQFLMIW